MQLAFIAVAGLAFVCLFIVRRRFDFFAVALVGALAYFSPAFWGEVAYPALGPILDVTTPIADQTYVTMIAVVGAIVAAALVSSRYPRIDIQIGGSELTGDVAIWIAFAAFLLCTATVGLDVLTSEEKQFILGRINRWYIIWETGATLGTVICFARRRWFCFAVGVLLLALTLFVGFRTGVAIAAISIFALLLRDRDALAMVKTSWPMLSFGLLLVVFLLAYKSIYIGIKLGDTELLASVLSEPDFWSHLVTRSEPFYTQGILNEIVVRNFRADPVYVSQALLTVVPFSNEVGIEIVSFNDLFQARLFPLTRDFGLANNIWGQMLASGGWPLLLIFILVFAAILMLGNAVFLGSTFEVSGGMAVCLAYWAFYIHRNDLAYQLILERRVVLLLIVCIVASKVLVAAKRCLELRQLPATRLTN